MKRLASAPLEIAVAAALPYARRARAADELSGADKLRVVYSNQFAWSADGLPIVTIGIGEGGLKGGDGGRAAA